MSFVHKVNQGSVFRNDKEGIDTRPDFSGSANIAGAEYWVSMWQNPPKDGKQGFFSVRFKLKDIAPPTPDETPRTNFDDDIPF